MIVAKATTGKIIIVSNKLNGLTFSKDSYPM
jgi:hypothetical protein